LSAIGGVFITAALWNGATQTLPLQDIQTLFSITLPHLLTATVFGLAPNLLMQSLMKQAETQKTESP